MEFGTDWGLDARRRDFTINALYCDMKGSLFDPLAAFEDLKERRVRFIGDPDQRLAEDRLRVYRFFRFTASHGGEIGDEEGLAACKRFSGDLGNLPAERIGAEMEKIFALPKIAATLAMMTRANVLDLDIGLLSALASYEDITGVPTISARLAILLGQMEIDFLRKSWRLSNSICAEAVSVREVAQMMIAGDHFQAAYKYGRLAYVALPVAAAISNWSNDEYENTRGLWDSMDVPSFPISGNDLLRSGFAQGEKLGQALRQIEAEWVKSGFKLSREQMLEKIKVFLG
ncbi:CCA tRNA nucleotidyltransferase [hydrothermal vent metagenome]|uniref:CCA tRNA nucleotidyltransferase n=1 Tax=hydrothermal vent metagenome TaxID=652676 RepID=A0A3B0TYT7_9ZZZZ